MIAMLAFGVPYTLQNQSSEAPEVSETLVEANQPDVTEEEVNPTESEESNLETTLEQEELKKEIVPEEPTPIPKPKEEVKTYPSSNHKVVYSQNEVRLVPQMLAICSCESGRQYHSDGTVVRGIVNPQDIGMCQINLKYHGAEADRLGYDLFSEVGNINYSNYLYAQQGAQPWFWSKPCHGQG